MIRKLLSLSCYTLVAVSSFQFSVQLCFSQHVKQSGALDAETAIAGFRAGRERLVSGHFNVRKVLTRKSERVVRDYTQVFDFASDRIRHDHQREGDDSDRGKYISTPEESLTLTRDERLVVKRTSGDYGSARGRPFDVRCLGIMDIQSFLNENKRFPFNQLVGALVFDANRNTNSNLHYSFELVQIDGAGLYRLARWNRKARWFNTIVFDPRRDFVPVEWKEWNSGKAWTEENTPPGEATDIAEMEWLQVNDVFVPSTVAYASTVGHTAEIALKFDWIEVNSHLPEDAFSLSGFNAPRDTRILDVRNRHPLDLGEANAPPLQRAGLASGRTAFWVANVVLLAVLAIAYWIKAPRRVG
ncbi:MAG: hypothetical protein WCJ09_15920 [Planctomycetota bacterium]